MSHGCDTLHNKTLGCLVLVRVTPLFAKTDVKIFSVHTSFSSTTDGWVCGQITPVPCPLSLFPSHFFEDLRIWLSSQVRLLLEYQVICRAVVAANQTKLTVPGTKTEVINAGEDTTYKMSIYKLPLNPAAWLILWIPLVAHLFLCAECAAVLWLGVLSLVVTRASLTVRRPAYLTAHHEHFSFLLLAWGFMAFFNPFPDNWYQILQPLMYWDVRGVHKLLIILGGRLKGCVFPVRRQSYPALILL